MIPMEKKQVVALLVGLCEITKCETEAVRELQAQVQALIGRLTGFDREKIPKASYTSRGTPGSPDPSLDWLAKAIQQLREDEDFPDA